MISVVLGAKIYAMMLSYISVMVLLYYEFILKLLDMLTVVARVFCSQSLIKCSPRQYVLEVPRSKFFSYG
jgi:hypothetical protein